MTLPPEIPIAAPELGTEEEQAVLQVLRSGRLAQGPVVESFESSFAHYVGAPHAVALGNGTMALCATLRCLGIGTGDEVITPAFSFVATANAVLYCGATPIFADIDPQTYTLDPVSVEAVLTKRTRALLPVHLYGQPADMAPLRRIAQERRLLLIEDACQAHGATYGDTPVGMLGDAACFSFYPTKNMTAAEGGMVTTADASLAQRLRQFRNQGQRSRYDYAGYGLNYRLSELHAAIGVVQLAKLPAATAARQRTAASLNAALADLQAAGVRLPATGAGRTHVFHQYTVALPQRDAVAAALTDARIGTGIYYPQPLHQIPFLRPPSGAPPVLPHAEAAAASVLSLPVHPQVSAPQVRRIADALTSAVMHGSAERHPATVPKG